MTEEERNETCREHPLASPADDGGRRGDVSQGRSLVHGIVVHIADRRFRGLLRAVLDHIGHRHPEDLERIRRWVNREVSTVQTAATSA